MHVVLRCDASRQVGVGHAVRCLALGQELGHRGHRVTLLGSLQDVDWLATLYVDEGIAVRATDGTTDDALRQVESLSADAVVLDGYALPPDLGTRLRGTGATVLAMVDSEFGAGQEADLYVDQNVGARPRPDLPEGAAALAGGDYALFRDTVLDRRRSATPPAQDPPRVLCVFGGTDPYDAARTVVPLLLATDTPVQVQVICCRPDTVAHLESLPLAEGQRLQVLPPVPDLPAALVQADAVVTASGSSVWELFCLGVPSAVVCVVDNQTPGYRAVTEAGLTVPVGLLTDLQAGGPASDDAVRELRRLVTDTDLRELLVRRGRDVVDGEGRGRVVDALESVVHGTFSPIDGGTA